MGSRFDGKTRAYGFHNPLEKISPRRIFPPCRLHILCLRMNSTSAACSTGLMVTSTSPALAAIMRIGHSGILAALPHRRDHAQLLQETQLVGATPMLHDLPLNQTIHVLGRDRDGLARWRDVLKLAGLGAVKGRTKGDGIPF